MLIASSIDLAWWHVSVAPLVDSIPCMPTTDHAYPCQPLTVPTHAVPLQARALRVLRRRQLGLLCALLVLTLRCL